MHSATGLKDLEQAFDNAKAVDSLKTGGFEEDYKILLPNFEGPLDLLLHLIRREQLNIYDIPVSRICENYLKFLDAMENPDCNLAGEFMVMAATLTFLKSVMLLPKEEEEGADDPRLPLVQKLLEYEQFKLAAIELDKREWLDRDFYPKGPGSTADILPPESLLSAPLDPIDPYQLLLGLKASLGRTQRKPLEITTDPISIKEKVLQIGELLENSPMVEFQQLLPEENRTAKDVVVAFFAMLELARMKYIEILQTENFGPIYLRGVRSLRELNVTLLDQF